MRTCPLPSFILLSLSCFLLLLFLLLLFFTQYWVKTECEITIHNLDPRSFFAAAATVACGSCCWCRRVLLLLFFVLFLCLFFTSGNACCMRRTWISHSQRSMKPSAEICYPRTVSLQRHRHIFVYYFGGGGGGGGAGGEVSSVQNDIYALSMRSEKPICAPPRLSEVSPTLSLKRFQCSSDWRWPSPVLSRRIV